ncbi:unnamed protein product, partial [Closterium sp. NIES-54]
MYALTNSAEGDCFLSVPPDPGIEAAALGASASAAPGTGESAAPGAGESALSSTTPTEALHTFTHDSDASRSFFRDSTMLTPLIQTVAVSLADPSVGPVLAHSSTVLPCPAALSGLLSGLHLPSFSTNMVSGADLQDAWVDQFAPGGQRVTHCTCSWTGRHLATFTRRPGSSLSILTMASPPISASGQVAASSQVFATASRSSRASAPCSCRPLTHETLLWHHRLGHPSLPRLRGMASRTLRAAPHSSSCPPTKAPLLTLHMDVWGPARVRGQGHERYFLLVVDDYSRYTSVFPLRSKGEVTEVLIDWIRGARRQLSESFGSDLPVLRLHSDRGAFVRILKRTSCPPVPFPVSPLASPLTHLDSSSTTPPRVVFCPIRTSRLTSWCLTTVSFPTALPLSPPPPLFLVPGTPPVDPLPPQGPAPSGVSQVDPAGPVEVAVDSGAARSAEPAGAGTGGAEPERVESWGAEPAGAEPGGAEPEHVEPRGSPGVPLRREPLSPQRLREWYARRCRRATSAARAEASGGAAAAGGAAGSGAAGGAAGVGAAGAACPGGARTGGTGAARAGGAAGVGTAGTRASGAGAAGGAAGAGATGGAAGAGAAGGAASAGASGGAAGARAVGAAGPGSARTGGTRVAEAGVTVGVGAAGTGDPGAEGTSAVSAVFEGVARPQPYYVLLLQQILGLPPSPGPTPPLL